MEKIYAIIPARGGSKGVPKKNIKMLGGFPLIAYPIAAAKLSPSVERIIVTTDSEEIADIARKFGAEVPFMRPAEISGDKATDLEFMVHAINWFKENEGNAPEYWVELRTTTPLRKPADIDAAFEMIKVHPDATSLRSGHEIRESPYKLFGIKDDFFVGLFPDDPRPEYYNLPRQSFPPVYQPNGYVDILKTSYIDEHNKQHGDKMLAFPSPDTGEIDGPNDFPFIEFKLQNEEWEIYEYLKKNFS
jgi:CMP-N,N'-diacetyllegionaminic acid synthase